MCPSGSDKPSIGCFSGSLVACPLVQVFRIGNAESLVLVKERYELLFVTDVNIFEGPAVSVNESVYEICRHHCPNNFLFFSFSGTKDASVYALPVGSGIDLYVLVNASVSWTAVIPA